MTTAQQRLSAGLAALYLPAARTFSTWNDSLPKLRDEKTKLNRKLANSLEDAITRSGLQDGDTISFHHHFRGGDEVVVPVVAKLAELGFRDLTLAPSSLHDCHAGLIEFIKAGVITKIYTSGMRGDLAKALSHGLMDTPVTFHSHGDRAAMLQTGEIKIDVAFIGVSAADRFGNANGISGRSHVGALGYAMLDAQHAETVVLVTEELVDYPQIPMSITQDQVDIVCKIDRIGDPAKIATGAARMTTDPQMLLLARYAADVIEHGGYFRDGFSMQTGVGAASVAANRFMADRMARQGIKGGWALGGISSAMVELADAGLMDKLLDTQALDTVAADHLAAPNHQEISCSQYANPLNKGAAVDQLDMVVLSALEIDTSFNVNVLTGSDGLMMGAIGGHPDTAAGAKLSILIAPLIRTRIPTIVDELTTLVTPGATVDVVVTDHGIAVNPNRPEVDERLRAAGLPVVGMDALRKKTLDFVGQPRPLEFTDQVVGVVRYRDGSIIDLVHAVAN